MKYYALLPFILFLACRSARYSDTKLSGEYSIGDYQMKGALQADSPEGHSFLRSLYKSKWLFNFYRNDSVAVYPEFGMKYLGDTLFRYKIVDDTLVLAHNKNIHKLPLTDNHGLIRLYNLDENVASFAMLKLEGH